MATVTAQLPPHQDQCRKALLAAQQALPTRPGNAKKHHGAIRIDTGSWWLDKPLELQGEIGLISDEPDILRGNTTLAPIIATFPSGEPLVRTKFSDGKNGNGNFDTKFRGIRFECLNYASGLSVGTGQSSRVDQIRVHNPLYFGIEILRGSRSLTLDSIDLDYDLHTEERPVGITALKADGITLGEGNIQRFDTGFHLSKCAGWRMNGVWHLEHTRFAATLVGCVGMRLDGFVIQNAADEGLLVDMSRCRRNGGNVIGGVIRRTKDPMWIPPGGSDTEPLPVQGNPASENAWATWEVRG